MNDTIVGGNLGEGSTDLSYFGTHFLRGTPVSGKGRVIVDDAKWTAITMSAF